MNSLGREGEELAIDFLKRKGYKILIQNYRTPFGEVDIIARDRECLVFIEVKTRAAFGFGQPFEAVNQRKRKKMARTALSYLKTLKQEVPARFDVLSICRSGEEARIEHIQDAFEI